MNNQWKTSLKFPEKLPNLRLLLGLWVMLSFFPIAQAQPIESTEGLDTKVEDGESPGKSPNTPIVSNDELPSIQEETKEKKDKPEFGEKGSKRWYIQGATAIGINEELGSPFFLGGAGISEFFINGHSINLELNKMSFFQTDDDAVGLNLAFLMRWQFYRAQNWSVFVDGGVGILGTTNDVPSSGSSLNFTPQVGGGTTIRLANDQRLFLGIRWHHISNGDIYENNPGRDSVMGYVGWNLPR